jgi:hypothetical protein
MVSPPGLSGLQGVRRLARRRSASRLRAGLWLFDLQSYAEASDRKINPESRLLLAAPIGSGSLQHLGAKFGSLPVSARALGAFERVGFVDLANELR